MLHLGKQTLFILGSAEEPPDDGRMTPGPGLSRLSEGGWGGEEHGWDLGRGAGQAGNHFFLSLRLVGELTSFVASKPSVPQTVRPLCVQEPFSAFPEQRALCPGAGTGLAPASRGPAAQWAPPRVGAVAGPLCRAPPVLSPCPASTAAGPGRCHCSEHLLLHGGTRGPLQEPRGLGRHVPL